MPQGIPFAEPLVEVTRGPIVESRHGGHLAAVDGSGRVVASLGEPETVAYLRSSSKPHQAIPLITTGAADRFHFTERQLAIACASHNGEPEHTETVAAMLSQIGLDAGALKCGAHEPYAEEAARELKRRGLEPTALHNNCSGKHAAMLAAALQMGASTEDYDLLQHPLQQSILGLVAKFSDVPAERISVGTDGCGAPTFAVPVRAMALMFARLVAPPHDWDQSLSAACSRLVQAMTRHPSMVEGEGEIDTELMRAAAGRIVSKVGAEAVYTAGVLPCREWPEGLGLAFKIEDGDKKDRARPLVIIEALRQLGLLGQKELSALARFSADAQIRNHRGDIVGQARTSFKIKSEVEARNAE